MAGPLQPKGLCSLAFFVFLVMHIGVVGRRPLQPKGLCSHSAGSFTAAVLLAPFERRCSWVGWPRLLVRIQALVRASACSYPSTSSRLDYEFVCGVDSTSSRFDNEFVCGVDIYSLCVLLIHTHLAWGTPVFGSSYMMSCRPDRTHELNLS